MKISLPKLALLSVMLLGGPSAFLPGLHAQAVRVINPRRGEIARSITLPANIVANQQVTLYAKVSGYLKSIKVDKGDEVNAGDSLADIEVPELLADLAVAKAELDIAQLDYTRAHDAQAKAPDLIVAQSVDFAKARQAMAKAKMERAETLLSFTKITAPFSGVVTKRMVDPGAFIPAATSGSTAQNSALLSISDFKTVRVQISVPESEVPLVKKGLPVKMNVEALPGQSFDGAITRFANVIDDQSKTMLAEVDLQNPKGLLRPGMYVTSRISIEQHLDTLLLPVEAVLLEQIGSSVFVVVDSKAKKKPVKTGFNDGQFVEILDGVAPADSVILVGKATINNGQPVTVSDTK